MAPEAPLAVQVNGEGVEFCVRQAGGDLFHYTGDFTSHLAIRNAYAETQNLGIDGLSLWAGSRMYRGDDIYLFDYWPLDNLNTIGAGARYEHKKFDVALHAGLNRLNDLYQYETLDTPPRFVVASRLAPLKQATSADVVPNARLQPWP